MAPISRATRRKAHAAPPPPILDARARHRTNRARFARARTDGLLNDAESDLKEQILVLGQAQANMSVTVAELRAGTEL